MAKPSVQPNQKATGLLVHVRLSSASRGRHALSQNLTGGARVTGLAPQRSKSCGVGYGHQCISAPVAMPVRVAIASSWCNIIPLVAFDLILTSTFARACLVSLRSSQSTSVQPSPKATGWLCACARAFESQSTVCVKTAVQQSRAAFKCLRDLRCLLA